MPKGFSDAGSDVEDDFQDTVAEADAEAKEQLNGELKDQVDEVVDEPVPSAAKEDDEEDLEVEAKGEENNDDDDDDDQEEDEDEFSVESIQDHKWSHGQLLYYIKWQGYPPDQNTWEPEAHLLPHSRVLLAAYHKKLGGPPQAPMKKGKSKQNLREATSSEELPASKRQKRSRAKDANEDEEDLNWLPKGGHWEDQVAKVETIERNEETEQLMAYILFKNGKRSKITMDMVYKHCPRPMLRFYEEHLKFK